MTEPGQLRQQRLPPLLRDEVDERFIHGKQGPAGLCLAGQKPQVVQRILDAVGIVRLAEEQQIHLLQQTGDFFRLRPVLLFLRSLDGEYLRTELLSQLAVFGEAGLDDPHPTRCCSQQQQRHGLRSPVAHSNPFRTDTQLGGQQRF
ncbi:hypothetical protein D3C80_1733600 [compost metagenome]